MEYIIFAHSVDRWPQSFFVTSFMEIKVRRNKYFFDSTTAQLCRQAEDAPTCSTGNAAFSPGTKLPKETRCREVVVVWGISIDRVLVAHAWIRLLEKELERTERAKVLIFHWWFSPNILRKQQRTHQTAFPSRSYLNPERFGGGPRRRQVLQVPCPLIGEYCPRCLVVTIPLDRPAPVQKVFVGVVTPESQEISSFSHFLDADIPGPLGNQSNVNVSWKKRKTESAESYVILICITSFIFIKSSKWFSHYKFMPACVTYMYRYFIIHGICWHHVS